MGLVCFHKWILWSGLCNDRGSFVEARVCLKCWAFQQQDAHGKWHKMGHLDPIKDKAWIDSIKQLYCDYFTIEEIC